MNLKFVLPVVLLLPSLSLAAETYEITTCDKGTELANAIDISDMAVRVTSSVIGTVVGEKKIPMQFSKKGSTIIVQLPNDAIKVTVVESERKPRVSDEYSKILTHVERPTGQPSALSGETVPNDKFKCIRLVQAYDLSRITIGVDLSSDDKSKPTITKTYIAGPREHWYFAADLPVTSTKQLSYDAQSASYKEKDVPATFFASINYKIGDIYINTKDFNPSLNNLSLKMMVKVNGPTEAYGMGVGFDIGSAVLFAARILTKNDPSASGADTSGTYSTIFGVSFDIERGIGWLSGK